jgi:H+-translocating NAD(P) transhydrogenase subunit alpha
MTIQIGVLAETAPRERRVALVPDGVRTLVRAGCAVRVQRGAGRTAFVPDPAYADAGGTLVDDVGGVLQGVEVLAKIQPPTPQEIARLPRGAVVVSLLGGVSPTDLGAALSAAGVTMLALERVPRITRAQSMDVLSSQSTVAGYKAVLLAASEMPRLLPMLTTAAGSLAPAKIFVLGAGVAGLQAIATARRLGAVVSAFDVRAVAREQVQSLGATFVAAEAVSTDGETAGGYAREQSAEQQRRTADAIARHVADMDAVITTAQVPGRPAPRLLTADMVRRMRPGSVIVDLAAETGGNCELTRAGETVDVDGVRVFGPLNIASTVPFHASQMYARNLTTFLTYMVKEGKLQLNMEDEIVRETMVTRGGEIVNARVREFFKLPALADAGK